MTSNSCLLYRTHQLATIFIESLRKDGCEILVNCDYKCDCTLCRIGDGGRQWWCKWRTAGCARAWPRHETVAVSWRWTLWIYETLSFVHLQLVLAPSECTAQLLDGQAEWWWRQSACVRGVVRAVNATQTTQIWTSTYDLPVIVNAIHPSVNEHLCVVWKGSCSGLRKGKTSKSFELFSRRSSPTHAQHYFSFSGSDSLN